MLILLFDIDGTLINTAGAGGAALKQAFRDEFGVADPADVPFSGRTDRGISSSLFALHGVADTQENWERLRAGYVQRLPVHLPQRNGHVLPGILRLLAALTLLDDVALGLLTGNVRDGAWIKLEYFGLSQHFAFGGFGDHHRHRNDVAQAALTAARDHLNGHPTRERVWVIGDTPLDVSCARAIHARALAVATGIHPRADLDAAEPDLLMDDLADTQRLLDLFRE